MPYFLLGLALIVGGYFIYHGLRGAGRQHFLSAVAILVVLGAGAAVVFLAVSGEFGPLGWLVVFLPLVFRWQGLRRLFGNLNGPRAGSHSDVKTRYLRMTLEHDTGVLRGTVLEGAHQGRNLDEMSLAGLIDLLRECRVHDPESATILETYLDRVHGAEWRTAGAGDGAGAAGGGPGGAPSGGTMTREQAYEILGLQPGASEEEIREAHRRLLKAYHPDRGGSTWLAAQINMAKDMLLRHG